MRHDRRILLLAALAILSLAAATGSIPGQTPETEFPPMFPFVISFDAPDNITNIAKHIDAPAGKHGFVRVKDGHFVTDKGQIRFWGTNLCFTANFPTKEQADKLADRLARFGYNCVRLCHLDTGNNSIVSSQLTLTELDRRKLDALDYLIAALKKRGIYVNINLHVGRWLDDRDGFPFREQRPIYDKGVGNFEPRMIELQKKYARDLLTHDNPYTKLPYTHDPCVAMVEISNEDSIVSEWSGGRLDSLPEPYGGLLRKLWNDWIREKYSSTEQLREALGSKIVPLGDEMCPDLNFETDLSLLTRRLTMQTDAKSKAEMWVVDKTLKLKVSEMGEVSWIPLVSYTDIPIKKGEPYTLSVRMRADKETTVAAGVKRNADPCDYLGGYKNMSLTPEWQTFDVSFYAADTFDNARIDVGGFTAGVIYEIDNISLRPGGTYGTKPDETLETGNVRLISPFDSEALPVMTRDYVEFLFRIEHDYWLGMYDFLKNDLKVQAPVTGTQINYGSMVVQSQLDYCDNHAYWNHPVFPGRDWDMTNWYVSNISLANYADKGTLTQLATQRVLGKPYTVSEYDHPFPNEYNAEGQPMIAAMGRFQDWDGIFPFAYAHSNNFEPDYVTGFFDSVGNVGRIAHTIACHTMFVRGDVAIANEQCKADMKLSQEIEIVANARSPWASRWGEATSEGNRLALLHGVGMAPLKYGILPVNEAIHSSKRYVSDTNQICWDMNTQGRGFMTVNTDNTKLFSGFVPDSVIELGDVSLAVGKTRLGWCTVSLVSYNASGFGGDGRAAKLLVAATGKYINTDMTIEHLGEQSDLQSGDDHITVGNPFGRGPVLCEGIPAVLTLPVAAERVTLYPLDASGNRKSPVKASPVAEQPALSTVELLPQYKTLWYEIEITER